MENFPPDMGKHSEVACQLWTYSRGYLGLPTPGVSRKYGLTGTIQLNPGGNFSTYSPSA